MAEEQPQMRKLENYEPTRFMLPTSHYDEDEADFAVDFIQCLKHTKGKWAGVPFDLIDWQERIIRDLFGVRKKNGFRQFNTAYVEIGKKNGKQVDLLTPIPTPSGYTTMGEVKVGDAVYDESGKVCHVVAKSEVDNTEQAYRIEFRTGYCITAGERHLWNVELIQNGRKSPMRICQTGELYRMTDTIIRIPAADGFPKPDGGYHIMRSITPLQTPVDMQCVQVDSNSHCYLIGEEYIPTHNSELAAAVALYLTCADGEQRAEVYGCASDRQQASIVFDVAADMVRMCPALQKHVKIQTTYKRITYKPTNSFYQVVSAEACSKHGFNISGVIFDELHTQPNRKLYDVMLQGSGDARMQPLYFLITTAGNNTNSICYEVHQKAVDILEGRKFDPTFYPVIYGAKMDEDWTDPEVWKRSNPSLGITVGIDKVQAACESAKQNPGEENAFRQLRLNQWVKQAVRWMPMDKWDACEAEIDEKELEGRVCYGGLDLAQTTDITAFVLVFPPRDETEKYIVLPYFWIPEDNIPLRVNRDHVPYDTWQKLGLMQATEGNVIHYDYIEKFIEELGTRFNIQEIAFDRWGAVQMAQDLEGMGFTVVPFGQGFKDMSPPTKELMKLVLEGKICHSGHKILRWMMDNIFIRQDPAGNIKMDKEKSTEKIDGAVATVMALDRAIRCGAKPQESVYDKRGMLFF